MKAIVVEYDVQPHFVDEEDIEGAKKFPSDEGGPPKKNSKDEGRVKPLGKSTKGKPEDEFSKLKLVHQGYYGIQTISHMCLEPHGAHSHWPDKDVLDVHLSTQNVSGTPGQFAAAADRDRRQERDGDLQLRRGWLRFEVRRRRVGDCVRGAGRVRPASRCN
ncbi:MAG: molybdopterin cofactor-binding domain-containing protein [Planctomycetales bacterium]